VIDIHALERAINSVQRGRAVDVFGGRQVQTLGR
jgi:hypothetical protein